LFTHSDKPLRHLFQNVAVDDVDVGLGGEALAQRLDQAIVQLDGDETTGAFRQRGGEHAFAGADLQHRVGWASAPPPPASAPDSGGRSESSGRATS
jgi:hypothetical protein